MRDLHPTDGHAVGLLMQEMFAEFGAAPMLTVEDHVRLFSTDWLAGGAGLALEDGGLLCGYGWARPSVWHGSPCVHTGLALRRGYRARGTHDLLTGPLVTLMRSVGREHRIPRAVVFCRSIDSIHPAILRDIGFGASEASMIGFRHDLRDVPLRPPPPDVVLRTASLPREIDLVMSLSGRAFTDRETEGEPMQASYLEFEAMRAGFHPGQVAVAEAGGEPAGYCILCLAGAGSDACYDIAEMAVAPEFRRRGIGAALVSNALLWTRSHGGPAAIVSSYSTNPASALYWRMGFRPDSARTYYFYIRPLNDTPE